mmetsp:Transcript_21925/g.53022  ORF Transcript_21925/g.53022 Transcript_21925/m.53022 type:complete len:325 (-) Transcript_21925:730-1704(-)
MVLRTGDAHHSMAGRRHRAGRRCRRKYSRRYRRRERSCRKGSSCTRRSTHNCNCNSHQGDNNHGRLLALPRAVPRPRGAARLWRGGDIRPLRFPRPVPPRGGGPDGSPVFEAARPGRRRGDRIVDVVAPGVVGNMRNLLRVGFGPGGRRAIGRVDGIVSRASRRGERRKEGQVPDESNGVEGRRIGCGETKIVSDSGGGRGLRPGIGPGRGRNWGRRRQFVVFRARGGQAPAGRGLGRRPPLPQPALAPYRLRQDPIEPRLRLVDRREARKRPRAGIRDRNGVRHRRRVPRRRAQGRGPVAIRQTGRQRRAVRLSRHGAGVRGG